MRRSEVPAAGPGPRRTRAVAVAAALLWAGPLLSGCAFLGPGSTSPDGLGSYEAELRGLLRAGRFGEAARRVAQDGDELGDRVLRLQYEGLVAHYAGRWEESNAALEAAALVAEDRVTRSLSRGALSLVTSDRVLRYRPPPPERLLIHYYGALNYLRLGDPEEAAVEARRLVHLLEVYEDDREPGPAERRLHATMRYVAAAAFEVAGEWNDASVAYRRAAEVLDPELLPSWVEPPPRAVTEVDGGPGPAAGGAPSAAGGAGPPVTVGGAVSTEDAARPGRAGTATGEVLVVVEEGFAAHRVERSLNLFLRDRELEALRPREEGREEPDWERLVDRAASGPTTGVPVPGGDEGRAAAALGLAERLLRRGALSGEGDRLGAGRRATRRGDDDLYLLRVAWPEFAGLDRRPTPLRIRLPASVGAPVSSAIEATPEWGADFSRALVEDFRRRQPVLLAKTLLRALAKRGVAEALEEAVEEEDELLGDIVGLAANAGFALLERADTRSWRLAPARIGLVRTRLPAGVRTVAVDAPDFRGGRTLESREVSVRPGRLAVVSVRAW